MCQLIVLEQTIALEDGEPDLVLWLAALLHDIGKAATGRHESGGGVSFHHHDLVGAKLTRKRLCALPTSTLTREDAQAELHRCLRRPTRCGAGPAPRPAQLTS